MEEKRISLPELIEEMSRRGYSTKQIRDELKQKGLRVRFNHTGTEQPGSRVARRRIKQMNAGQLPKICETVDCGRVVERCEGSTAVLCWSCLGAKWAPHLTEFERMKGLLDN